MPSFAHSSSRRSACEPAEADPSGRSRRTPREAFAAGTPRAAERDRQRHREVRARAPRCARRLRPFTNTSELASATPGVPRENGDDHREALRIDSGAPTRRGIREVRQETTRLDLEQDRPPGALEQRSRPRRRPRRRARRAEELRRIGHALEPRARSSRRRRARSSSRSGSSSRAQDRGARGSGRPRTGGRSRRGARGRAGRRRLRPS